MEQKYSLMAILREDPDFAGALAKKKEAVKKDKENLLKAAESYTEKYEEEIAEGTKLRQKLLTEGQSQGLSEEEIFRGSSKFIPTVYTPILNWLFFTFREEANQQKNEMNLEKLTQYYIEKFGYDGFIKKLEEGSVYAREVYADRLEDILSNETEKPEEMEHFVYGTLTGNDFQKLKKLKALSRSSNEKEAFAAYKKCLELCKKFNLEFDKIPCRY
jgi:hypothetical protein